MSSYTRDTVKQLVAARMDEVIPQGENLDGQVLVEAPLAYIEQTMDSTAWEILQKAPKDVVMEAMFSDKLHFHGGSAKTTPTRLIYSSADSSVKVVCPDNFLRLISIQLNDSVRPIEDPVKDTSGKKKHQHNPFLKGTKEKPVGALISFSAYTTSGGSAVEETDTIENNIYPNCNKAIQIWCTDDETPALDHFHYIGKMVAEDIPDILIEPLVWEVAARALAITRQFEASNAARAQAAAILKQLNVGYKGEQ